jgi:membrane fusion protein, multidrug efflux system
MRRYIVVLLGVIVLIGGLGSLKAAQIKTLITYGQSAAAAGPPPEVVGTIQAKEETWENRLFSVGTIATARGVTVSNDAAGMVKAIKFESGQKVRKGQVLVELNRRVELADLASAQARYHLAHLSAERSRNLFKENAVPRTQLDNDESNLRSATGSAASLQAQIARKVVRAPFDGRLGIRQVNLGQYLKPGTPITTLESTGGDYVDFTLPQQDLPRLAVGMLVHINETSSGPRAEATIAAIDPALDSATRSARVRAAMAKETGFGPGMFVNVAVVLPEKRKVVLVAATSLVHASYGDSIFVAEDVAGSPHKTARQQFVKPGEARGDFVEILEGVKPGDEIVSQGAFKLRNGVPIAVNNSIKIGLELAPRPENR